MFEARTTEELVRIAIAGGGFDLNASARTTDELVRIAIAAKNNRARIGFRGLGARTTDEIVRIAIAGGGAVKFLDALE